jgi:hypothetical protein
MRNVSRNILEMYNRASAHTELASLAMTEGKHKLAREHLRQAVDCNRQALKAEPTRAVYVSLMVKAYLLMVEVHRSAKEWAQAERLANEAIGLATGLLDNGNKSERTWLSDALMAAGKLREVQDDRDGAAAYYARSAAVRAQGNPSTSAQVSRP